MKKEKNGPQRLVRPARRVYTTAIMQGTLAALFGDNEMLCRKMLCDQLGQILSEKRLSRKAETKRVIDSFLNREFIRYDRDSRVYQLTTIGALFVAKTKYAGFLNGEKPRMSFRSVTVRAKCQKQSCPQNKRFSGITGYDGILILQRLYEHDAHAEFLTDNFKRWLFDLMCAEWYDMKSCKGVSGPTHKQANRLFQKMLSAGLIMEKEIESKMRVILTKKGIDCCGFSEQRIVERIGKRDKYERFASKVTPLQKGKPPVAHGLRALKKMCRSVAACSA